MADGNLEFDTKIDTTGFEKDVNTIKKSFNTLESSVRSTGRAVDNAFSGKTSSRVIDLNNKISETESKIKLLRDEMQKMADTPFVSKEADKLTTQLEKAEQQLLSLLNQREKFEDSFKSELGSLGLPTHSPEVIQQALQGNKEWQKLTSQISQAEIKLSQYEAKLQEVRQADSLVATTGTTEYTKKELELQNLTNRLGTYRARLEEVEQAELKKAQSAREASKSANKLNKSIKDTSRVTKSANKHMAMFNRMIVRLIMYKAIRGVINGIADGMKNLVQVSPELNKNLSSLRSNLTQLKNSLATAFAPIVNFITPVLNSFIQLLARAADAVARFFAVLGGKNTYKKAIEVQEDYAESLKKTEKQAKKSAKGIGKSLTVIDEANILSSGLDDSGLGSEIGELTPEQMFDEVAIDSKLSAMVERFKDKLKEIGIVIKESFKDGFESGLGEINIETLKEHLGGVKQSLTDIFKDADVKQAAKDWLINVSYALGETIGAFASMGLTIAEVVLGSIDKYLEENTGFIKEKLISIFDLRGQSALIFSNLVAALADIFTIFRSEKAKQIGADLLAIFINSFFELLHLGAKLGRDLISVIAKPIIDNKDEIKKALENTLGIVSEVVGGIKDFVANSFESIHKAYDDYIAPALESFSSGFSKVFEAVLETYNKYFAPVIKELTKKIREVINGPVADMVDSFMTFVGKLVGGIADIWDKTLAPFIAWLTRTFGPVFSKVLGGMGSSGISVFSSLVGAIKGLFNALGGLVDFIAGVFTGDWKRAWNGIKAIFKGVWDSFVGIAKAPINLIIDLVNGMLGGLQSGLNAVVKALNKISVKIPNWVPRYGGSTFGINLRSVSMPKIPRLATGTVVPANYGEFMAILGDNTREAEVVSPLSTMKQAFKEALREGGYGKNGDINLNVYLEGRHIYQEVVKQNDYNTRRTGQNALAT